MKNFLILEATIQNYLTILKIKKTITIKNSYGTFGNYLQLGNVFLTKIVVKSILTQNPRVIPLFSHSSFTFHPLFYR